MTKLSLWKLTSIIIGMFFYATATFANPPTHPVITEATQEKMTPWEVEQMLKQGNERFVSDTRLNRSLVQQAKLTGKKQFPVAVVLSCMDSRGSPELIFDQGIGDIFSIRVAGNVLNDDIIASLEFATQVVGSKLIIIMGHTNCGAVAGACSGVKLGHITDLLAKIHPAVVSTEKNMHSKDCNDPQLIDEIARNNVNLVLQQIKAKSSIVDKLVTTDKVGIVGAMHDLKSGKVTFFGEEKRWLPGMPAQADKK
jgi:carbonic anhydrase